MPCHIEAAITTMKMYVLPIGGLEHEIRARAQCYYGTGIMPDIIAMCYHWSNESDSSNTCQPETANQQKHKNGCCYAGNYHISIPKPEARSNSADFHHCYCIAECFLCCFLLRKLAKMSHK